MVFKKGALGVGYYADVGPAGAAAAAQVAARAGATAGPSSTGAAAAAAAGEAVVGREVGTLHTSGLHKCSETIDMVDVLLL
jgi:hypothetical protein